jgi:lipid II:glycine glycyltransferase (peptidoglycan interpeptide bridge formation enzyme)
MYLHTAEPKTADQLLARLREIERGAIRRATPDGLEQLRVDAFRVDGPVSVETMAEVKRRLDEDFANAGDYNQGQYIVHKWAS